MPESRQDILNSAMEDLAIAAEGHGKSKTYQKMETALHELVGSINKFYGEEGGNPPLLSEADLRELNDKYSTALRRCQDYTEGKGTSRSSGYGTARLKSVLAIEDILQKDLKVIRELDADKMTLPMAMGEARVTDVRLDVAEENLILAGANSSTRIPIAMKTELGTVEGYFTEDSYVFNNKGILKNLEEYYGQNEVTGRILDKGKKNGKFNENLSYSFNKDLKVLWNQLQNKYGEKEFPGIIGECIENEEAFREKLGEPIRECLEEKYGITLDSIASGRENRNAFLNMMQDFNQIFLESASNGHFAGIPAGENIPNRNVGMSRMADLLGMEGLIAKAERVKITDQEGNQREGVFQETAKGSDFHHLKQDDLLYAVSDDPDILEDGHFKKQLADLQVLDYICGNTDRHPGNIMYDMERRENGKVGIKTIRGIDNDRAFGILDEETILDIKDKERGCYVTVPEDMKVISSSAAEAVRGLTKDKLTLALKDLNFSEKVIDSCMKRAEEIKTAIDQKKIQVVEDEKFKDHEFDLLGVNNNPGYTTRRRVCNTRTNYFYEVGALKDVKRFDPEPEKETVYNAATAQAKRYEKTEKLPVYAKDLGSLTAKLTRIHTSFEKSDHMFHRDGGTFKWMKNSLNASLAELQALEAKYTDGNMALEQKDAEKLDGLLRQLSNASKEYIRTHPDPGHDMGKARKAGAEEMKNLEAPRLARPEAEVTDLSFEEANRKILNEGEQKKEEKPRKVHRITKSTVREAGRAKNGPVKEGP